MSADSVFNRVYFIIDLVLCPWGEFGGLLTNLNLLYIAESGQL